MEKTAHKTDPRMYWDEYVKTVRRFAGYGFTMQQMGLTYLKKMVEDAERNTDFVSKITQDGTKKTMHLWQNALVPWDIKTDDMVKRMDDWDKKVREFYKEGFHYVNQGIEEVADGVEKMKHMWIEK
jgi:hypothetical protein